MKKLEELIEGLESSIKTMKKDENYNGLELLEEIVPALKELQEIKSMAQRLNDAWQEAKYTDSGEANELVTFILKEN